MHRRVKRLILALSEAKIEYLIVGGVAVTMHGHSRVTRTSTS